MGIRSRTLACAATRAREYHSGMRVRWFVVRAFVVRTIDRAFSCQVPGHSLRFVSGHPLHGVVFVCRPRVHVRGPFAGNVELADQGVSIEDQDALMEADQADLFSGQWPCDLPLASCKHELARSLQAGDFGADGIDPGSRVGLEAPLAGPPYARRGLHLERFVRPDMVVLLAEIVQPRLVPLWLRQATAPAGHLKGAVEALHLALGP